MAVSKTHVALYGNVAMAREWCEDCNRYALVLNKLLQCCDAPSKEDPKKYKRYSEPESARKQITAKQKQDILLEQDYRCLYCEKSFDSYNKRNTKNVILKIVWDHALPWAYSQDNSAKNYVAACQICNGIKSDHVYKNIDEARIDIRDRRISKGYEF